MARVVAPSPDAFRRRTRVAMYVVPASSNVNETRVSLHPSVMTGAMSRSPCRGTFP